MQKTCSQCQTAKPILDFKRRAASADGYTASCRACINAARRTTYWSDPAHRAEASARASRVKAERFERDPAYKRAFNQWGTVKKVTTIPACMKIVDFVPICRKAIKAGPLYELDHVVPLVHPDVCGLHVPWNLRVVLKKTNRAKGNKFRSHPALL